MLRIQIDLHEYIGGANIIPTTPHPITSEKVPLTLGHEFSGVIEEVGEDVSDIKVGDRVVVQPIIYDGTCGACREGYINCCDNNGFVGLSGIYSPSLERSITENVFQVGAAGFLNMLLCPGKLSTQFLKRYL